MIDMGLANRSASNVSGGAGVVKKKTTEQMQKESAFAGIGSIAMMGGKSPNKW